MAGPRGQARDYSKRISNPLTLIAIFAGLAETAATAVLPVLPNTVQAVFVWFVMLFPVFLVVLFFATLNFNARVLYAPSDYQDERLFVSTLRGAYDQDAKGYRAAIEAFWKPGGVIDKANERRLKQWMRDNGIAENSVTFFLRNKLFEDARGKLINDFGL